MRPALLLLLVATACTEEPSSGGPYGSSVVSYRELPGSIVPKLDIVVVIDHTTAMQPYLDQLAKLPEAMESFVFDPDGGLPDIRIAVTTADGAGTLRQASTTLDPYLARAYDERFRPSTNVAGSFSSALAELFEVGAESTGPRQPLESARRVLDAHPDFLRDHGFLGIVTLAAGDDASPGTVADYASSLKMRFSDPTRVMVVGIHPEPSARLDEFYDLFPSRAATTPLATADFATVLDSFSQAYRQHLYLPCMDALADVDPEAPGEQYDCSFEAVYEDGGTEVVPACAPGLIGPCFEILDEPLCENGKLFRARGFPTRYLPAFRGYCVAPGGD